VIVEQRTVMVVVLNHSKVYGAKRPLFFPVVLVTLGPVCLAGACGLWLSAIA
jgi:hypothetical protein